MSTVDIEQQPLLIGEQWTAASTGATFERRDRFAGETVTLAAAAGREDARAACDAAASAFAAWSGTAPGDRRMVLTRAGDLLMERAPDIAGLMTEEVGGAFGWGMFNCDLASRSLREAAAQTYAVNGEVIPSDVPGSLGHGGAPAGRRRGRDGAVERARHPGHARGGVAACLRQHGGAQGIGDVSGHPCRGCPRDRRRWSPGRGDQPGHPFG